MNLKENVLAVLSGEDVDVDSCDKCYSNRSIGSYGEN